MSCRGCNQGGHHGNKCDDFCCEKNKCLFRFKVPCQKVDMNGMVPPPNGGGQVHELHLASFEAQPPNGQFIGLGTTSATFPRSSVVIPQNATIIGMVFSIRNNTLPANATATAEIVLSRSCAFPDSLISTGVIATVTGPSSTDIRNCCASTTANLPVNKCDLLSVRITSTGGGALEDGVAVTILYTIP